MSKARWNIWRIKNPPLRAALVFVFGTPVIVGAAMLTAVISIAVGICEGFSYAWWMFTSNKDVKEAWRGYWRAITLKGAP